MNENLIEFYCPSTCVIWTLQYLTNTRLDISYIENKLNQFFNLQQVFIGKPLKEYYLSQMNHVSWFNLYFAKSYSFELAAFKDVDWANCSVDDIRSIIIYRVFIGDCLVFWSSKKYHLVTRSSTQVKHLGAFRERSDL